MLIVENPPTLPGNSSLIGLAYDFMPYGATFDPFINITLQYDPSSLPEGVSEQNIYIAYADTATGEWVKLRGNVDSVKHNVTAQATHFTVFAILVETTLKSTGALAISRSLIGILIGGLALLAFILYLRARRRKSDADRYWGRELIPARRTEPREQWYWSGKEWVPSGKEELGEQWHWSGDGWIPPRNKVPRDDWHSDWAHWVALRRIEASDEWNWSGNEWVRPGNKASRDERYSDWARRVELRKIEASEEWYWDGSRWVQPVESSQRPSRNLQFSGKK